MRGLDLVGPSNGASASTARRRTAGGRGNRRGSPSSPRSSPIAPSAATHDSRTSGVAEPVASSISRPSTSSRTCLVLAARPRGLLHHGDVGVIERGEQVDAGASRRDLRRSPPHRGVGVAKRHGDVDVVEETEAVERTERERS